jgi:hypothetical protein
MDLVDGLQVATVLYGAFGGLFAITRDLSFSRWVRLNGTKISYGSVPATIRERESRLYFLFLSAIVGAGGVVGFELIDQFGPYSNVIPVLIVSVPYLLDMVILGFDSHVIDLNGMIGVYPRGEVGRFFVTLFFALLYPLVMGLALGISGIIPAATFPFLWGITFIPTTLFFIVVFLPIVLGEWLFGTDSLSQAVPYSLKNPMFRMMLPISLLMVWYVITPHGDLVLFLCGAIPLFLLSVVLSRVRT